MDCYFVKTQNHGLSFRENAKCSRPVNSHFVKKHQLGNSCSATPINCKRPLSHFAELGTAVDVLAAAGPFLGMANGCRAASELLPIGHSLPRGHSGKFLSRIPGPLLEGYAPRTLPEGYLFNLERICWEHEK